MSEADSVPTTTTVNKDQSVITEGSMMSQAKNLATTTLTGSSQDVICIANSASGISTTINPQKLSGETSEQNETPTPTEATITIEMLQSKTTSITRVSKESCSVTTMMASSVSTVVSSIYNTTKERKNLCQNLHSYCRYRNVSMMIRPTRGWQIQPRANDVTEVDDIERICFLRNFAFARVPSTKDIWNDWRKYWDKLEGVCQRMDKRLRDTKFEEEMIKIKTCFMDGHSI